MNGPFPPGTFRRLSTSTVWERSLVRGQRYRVVKSFHDFDRSHHEVGEEWYFVGSNFVPYDDGLSVLVATEDRSEWQIRLSGRPDDQLRICENFNDYVSPVEGDRRAEYADAES